MQAQIEIECKNPEQVMRAVEIDNSETKKFSCEMKVESGKIILNIGAKDISGLMAGINSNLKMVKIAGETNELI